MQGFQVVSVEKCYAGRSTPCLVAGAVVVAGAAAVAAGAARTRATIAVKRATGPPIAAHLVAARTAHLLMSLVQYVGNHIKSPSVS